jgi:hypothetical protein
VLRHGRDRAVLRAVSAIAREPSGTRRPSAPGRQLNQYRFAAPAWYLFSTQMPQRKLSIEEAKSLTELSTLQDGSPCFRSSKYTAILTLLGPKLLLITSIGYDAGDSAPLMAAQISRFIAAKGKLNVFANLTTQTGQASVAREWWAEWAKLHRAHLGLSHILVRNRVTDMAISVLAMLIGGGVIKSHASQASFEAAIAEQVPGFRSLPTFADLPPLRP